MRQPHEIATEALGLKPRDWIAEARNIVNRETMAIGQRQHLVAVVALLEKYERGEMVSAGNSTAVLAEEIANLRASLNRIQDALDDAKSLLSGFGGSG